MNHKDHFELGTATVIAPNLESAVSFRIAFLAAAEFVMLWEIKTVPDSTVNSRLRWRSADRKTIRYFRVKEIVPCDFPVIHVDLRIQPELSTVDEIKTRQDEIVKELGKLSGPLFGSASPTVPVRIEELFRSAERQAKRELLRDELRDLSVMLAEKA